ncbi:MAG: Fe-S-containing protein [Bacillota bacterium]
MNGHRSNKQEQFTQPKVNRLFPLLGTVTLLVLGAAFTLFYFLNHEKTAATPGGAAAYFGDPVAEARSYIGDFVSMTVVDAAEEGGWLTLPLELVSNHDIVYFEAENDEGIKVPLMAYITPSGRLFAGSSMCEPCRGRTYSLAGETLVCDTCRTTYTIEDHRYISGSTICGTYPPVYMDPVIEEGKIKIPLDQVAAWRIRS